MLFAYNPGMANSRRQIERQREYRARKFTAGLIEAVVWIPQAKKEELHEFAARLRREYEDSKLNRP